MNSKLEIQGLQYKNLLSKRHILLIEHKNSDYWHALHMESRNLLGSINYTKKSKEPNLDWQGMTSNCAEMCCTAF